MKTADLHFEYPAELIATEPKEPCRVLLSRPGEAPLEITKAQVLDLLAPGDVLVINDSQVIKSRVFTPDNLEILFLEELEPQLWRVLFPARDTKIGTRRALTESVSFELVEKGLPQIIRLSESLTSEFFERHGEFALPPYIQASRQERHHRASDERWYQTAWAAQPGSRAAPTASLHFANSDLIDLQERGVQIAPLTLHVGLGTFLPVKSEHLEEHPIHREFVSIPPLSAQTIQMARQEGRKIWALGTTVVRSLESWASGRLGGDLQKGFHGETDLYVFPGHEFQLVDGLLTNFHQPQSTLLALVMAFAGRERVLDAYHFAVTNRFRLFSYGDLSVWLP